MDNRSKDTQITGVHWLPAEQAISIYQYLLLLLHWYNFLSDNILPKQYFLLLTYFLNDRCLALKFTCNQWFSTGLERIKYYSR